MQLPKALHKRLADEFRFAADRMAESGDPYRRLYFFSAFYGEAGRTLNFAWERNLVLLHSVTHKAHQSINGRLQAMSPGAPMPIEAIVESLTVAADELAKATADNDDAAILEVLKRVAELEYAVSGNGAYLMAKGVFKP